MGEWLCVGADPMVMGRFRVPHAFAGGFAAAGIMATEGAMGLLRCDDNGNMVGSSGAFSPPGWASKLPQTLLASCCKNS